MKNAAHKHQVKFTYYDYSLLPEEPRYELIDGDLLMTPSPTTIHQWISVKLEQALSKYIQRKKQGILLHAPMDVVLSNDDVVQPDIIYITNERKNIIKEENIRGAPDLLIEILSPSTAERDIVIKRRLYEKHRVREYWIVDPQNKMIEVIAWTPKGFKTIKVYPAGRRLKSQILPSFSLPLKNIFDVRVK